MKNKTANLVKLAGVIYLAATSFYSLASIFLFPIFTHRFYFNLRAHLFPLIYVVCNLIALAVYLSCTDKKPVSTALLIAPFGVRILAQLASCILETVLYFDGAYSYYFGKSYYFNDASHAIGFLLELLVSFAVDVIFYAFLYLLVPRLISGALVGGAPQRTKPAVYVNYGAQAAQPAYAPQQAPAYAPQEPRQQAPVYAPQQPQRNPAPANASDTAEALKSYKELLDAGVITQEEFDAKKKQILGI